MPKNYEFCYMAWGEGGGGEMTINTHPLFSKLPYMTTSSHV